MTKFFRKYHKWLSIILAYFILSFVISGIILNHRKTLSFIDINRKYLPKNYYQYQNWNNAAVNSTLKLNNDSILIYGNIGIWLTDSTLSNFSDFNSGFPKGIDNRKIIKIIKLPNNNLLAGSFFGLYKYQKNEWKYVQIPVKEERITDIIEKQDTIVILTRSHLLKTTDLQSFEIIKLPPPENYDNKISVFKTLWVIHSGEIYGTIGKLIVDFAGLIFAFLTITGFIIFINKIILKKNNKPQQKKAKLRSSTRWNIKWHNKIGWITIILLLVNTTTGMFLRPPMLIAIANSKVKKIPHTELATPNPWFDQLRRVCYDADIDRYIIATSKGFYYSDDNFSTDLKMFDYQPPASIMGVTVLEKFDTNEYLVGSFEGLFLWNSETGKIWDYITNKPYVAPVNHGRPIGQFLITGYSKDFDNQKVIFDYNFGAMNILTGEKFTKMPQNIIENSPISLWNLALELHTGRLYQFLIGDFYILIVPLVGLSMLFILISGLWVWLKSIKK